MNNKTKMAAVTREEIDELYRISGWSDGYFGINNKGHLCVLPEKSDKGPTIDMMDVIDEMKLQNIEMPAVIRFHDILWAQVKNLNETFAQVIGEAEYKGLYRGVYPIKVNQMREVVEEIVLAGKPYSYGLEAGSKPELLSVLAYNTNQDALTVLNGYKDEEYLRLALLGRKLGRKIFVVVEKFTELTTLLRLADEMEVEPLIGIRAKISVKGAGKWSDSGGEKAKFGLSTPEIIKAVHLLKERNLEHCFRLLHFHIGSQVTSISTIKEAISEGGRFYTSLRKMGMPIEYFDVGGGLGVDYDGSNSTNDSSKNYSTYQYCEDIVYGLKQICDYEKVPHPNIVTESGRFITAHHSCVVTNVIDKIETTYTAYDSGPRESEHLIIKNLRDAFTELEVGNYKEIYDEVEVLKRDCMNAFKLGVFSLEERAIAESLFWKVMKKINDIVEKLEEIPEEFQNFSEEFYTQYLCNVSIFQSFPDTWAIDQLLPIAPIHRLNEMPTKSCILADITCDSDGNIDEFIDSNGATKSIKLHELKNGEKYYIGFFLTGAYQDVMGDNHNLFGRLNEVHVFCDDDDPTDFYIEEVIRGSSAQKVLEDMQYDFKTMALSIKNEFTKLTQEGKISPRESVRMVDFYEQCLKEYTYLKN